MQANTHDRDGQPVEEAAADYTPPNLFDLGSDRQVTRAGRGHTFEGCLNVEGKG